MTHEYDELVKQLYDGARKEAEAHRMITDSRHGPTYESMKPEHSKQWKAASAITRLNADLAKKNEELEYARAGIGYAEAAKLLETVDSLTADLAYALEALKLIAKDAPTEEPEDCDWTGNADDSRDYGSRHAHWYYGKIAAAELAKHKAAP